MQIFEKFSGMFLNLFYYPSNSIVCSTSNNSTAEAYFS